MSKTRIYTPKQEQLTVDALRKPLVLHLPRTPSVVREVVQVLPIPTTMSLLGLDSAGGPPGFVCLEHDLEGYEKTRLDNPRISPGDLFIGAALPGAEYCEANAAYTPTYLGTCPSTAVLISYFIFTGPSPAQGKTQIETLEEGGVTVIPLVEHLVEEELLRLSTQAATGLL